MTSRFANPEFDGTTLLTGYAVGTFGVVAYVFTVIARGSIGPDALTTTIGNATALYGTPLLAAVLAGNLASDGGYTIGDVLGGFSVGGLIFGVAVGWMRWTQAAPGADGGALGPALFALALTLSVPVLGLAGALVADRFGGSGDVAAAT